MEKKTQAKNLFIVGILAIMITSGSCVPALPASAPPDVILRVDGLVYEWPNAPANSAGKMYLVINAGEIGAPNMAEAWFTKTKIPLKDASI